MDTILRKLAMGDAAINNRLAKLISKSIDFLPGRYKRKGIFLWENLAFRRYDLYDKEAMRFRGEHPMPSAPWKYTMRWLLPKHLLRGISWLFASPKQKQGSYTLVLPDHLRYGSAREQLPDLPMLSVIRDPFDWNSSMYYYKVQAKDAGAYIEPREDKILGGCRDVGEYLDNRMMQLVNLRQTIYLNHIAYSGQKDMSFTIVDPYTPHADRELQIGDKVLASQQDGTAPKYPEVKHFGYMTHHFTIMFFERPWEILTLPPAEFDEFWSSGKYKEAMPKVTFLEQEELSLQLKNYLSKFDYAPTQLQEIDKLPPRIHTSKNFKIPLEETYNRRDLVEKIYQLEKPIFIMFPQYEKIYNRLLNSAKAA